MRSPTAGTPGRGKAAYKPEMMPHRVDFSPRDEFQVATGPGYKVS